MRCTKCTGIWPSEYWKIIWKRASQSRRFPVCLQSVEITIYRWMERCGLRALNFSNISDDEFWTWRKWRKIFLFVENKCWIFFTKKEASKECHENSDFWPQTLKLQTLCNVFMFKGNSQKEARYFDISSGLSLSHRSDSEKLTRFKIAADILIRFAGEYFIEEIKDTESLWKYNVVQIKEESYIHQTRQRWTGEDKYLDSFWLLRPMNIVWP